MLLTVYLAKFQIGDKVAYKVGHTKWYYAHKRFDDEQYEKFDKVEILGEIRVHHKDPSIARDKAKTIEACLKGVFPKNFYLEEHFEKQPKYFDNLSGITEMFIINFEERKLINVFEKVKLEIGRTFQKTNE